MNRMRSGTKLNRRSLQGPELLIHDCSKERPEGKGKHRYSIAAPQYAGETIIIISK